MEEIILDDLFMMDEPLQHPKDDDNKDTAPDQTASQIFSDDGDSGGPPSPEPDSSVPDDVPEVDPEQLGSYYETLKSLNILDVPDDFAFDGTTEGLEKAFELTKVNMADKVAQSLWERLPEDFKPVLEFALSGGTDIKKYLDTYSVNIPDALPDSEEAQRKLIFDYYRNYSKYDDAKIQKIIDRAEKNDELEQTAKEALEDLREFQEDRREKMIEQQKAVQAQRAIDEQKRTDEVLKNIETSSSIEDTRKNKIKAFFFNPMKVEGESMTQYTYALRSILANPEHLVQLGDLLADYSPKVGFDFSRFEAKVKTKATQSFKQLIHEKLDPKNNMKGSSNKAQHKENFD